MSLRTLTRAACLLLALALLLPLAPAARAQSPELPGHNDPWYVFSFGPGERRREIVDRYGNAPAAMDGVDARRIVEIMRQYTNLEDGGILTLGYALYATLTLTPEQQALLDATDEGAYVDGVSASSEAAFMKLDGTLLFDFAPDTSFGIVGDRYVSRTTRVTGPDGLFDEEYLLVDIETGTQSTPLPGRYINWFRAFGDGFAASTSAFGEHGVIYENAELVLMDAAFNTVKTVPCESAYPDTWLGEPIVLVHTALAGDRSISALDAKGALIAGPYPYGGYIAEHGGVPQSFVVYEGERVGTVDRATGEIAWHDAAQTAPRGGLIVFERPGQAAMNEYHTMVSVRDEAGKTIVPDQPGTVSFTDTSPLLVTAYGQSRSAAVYSRTGERLGKWEEGVVGSGLLYEQHMAYVVTAAELVLFDAAGARSIPMPQLAKHAWLAAYGELLVLEYYDETASNYYTSMLSADRTRIDDPVYSSIYPIDFEDHSRGYRVSKTNGRRYLMGTIDAEGRELIPCRFTQLYADDRDDLFYAAAGSYYGLVDAQGNWVLRRSEMRYLND